MPVDNIFLPEYRQPVRLFIKGVSAIMGYEVRKGMIKFVCESCGATKKENVLPGKHAVIGTYRKLDDGAECCRSPQYFDSRGFRREMVQRDLRGMVSSLRA